MTTGSVHGMIATHVPRVFNEDQVLPVHKPLLDGLKRMGQDMERLNPDVIVLLSSHWFTTFPWYAGGNARWKGVLVGTEIPDMVNGWAYDFPGHPALAQRIVQKGQAAGIMCKTFDVPDFPLDYGTGVPLKYIQRKENPWPVVPLSVCMQEGHEEAFRWGEAIGDAIRESGLNVAFIASGALSHDLCRSPEAWPVPENMAADKLLLSLLESGRLEEARQVVARYGRVHSEAWGKHLIALFGVLSRFGSFQGESYCYGPSSGSGNTCMLLSPVQAAAKAV